MIKSDLEKLLDFHIWKLRDKIQKTEEKNLGQNVRLFLKEGSVQGPFLSVQSKTYN